MDLIPIVTEACENIFKERISVLGGFAFVKGHPGGRKTWEVLVIG